MGTIYVLRNRLNGKCYVGQTRNLNKRLAHHKCPGETKRSFIGKAIGKYGWDNFDRLFFHGIPEGLIDDSERLMIRALRSQKPNGYNLEGGGCRLKHHHPDSNHKRSIALRGERHPLWGTHLSDEQRKHLSEIWRGRRLSDDTKRKISIANTGKKRTDEMNLANSIRMAGRFVGAMNPMAKRVICIETRRVFGSIRLAAKEYGINHRHIGECCAGKHETCGGCHWSFLNQEVA